MAVTWKLAKNGTKWIDGCTNELIFLFSTSVYRHIVDMNTNYVQVENEDNEREDGIIQSVECSVQCNSINSTVAISNKPKHETSPKPNKEGRCTVETRKAFRNVITVHSPVHFVQSLLDDNGEKGETSQLVVD
ncbi:hypothetical protein TrispH2_006060 [Trichoplax sp. H2]|nr:hypothetical protein TrispH2_006060 [Trichoplax sp. H2]|eukprot:RDD43141.1 hypothetical protein TrispH2_006060 [Trichoplax sp. H2]